MMKKKAFTLIEVMVSVMIISVVILALLKMKSNNSFIFTSLKKQNEVQQYISLIIDNKDYKDKNKDTTLDALIKEFHVDDELRRKLKNQKIKLIHNEVKKIDLNEEANTDATLSLVISEDLLKLPDSSTKIFRVSY